MAKFAQVGYGSQGQGISKNGIGYTYVVNDNVRTGDKIFPVAKHYQSGKVFATTGKVLSRSENLSTEKNLKEQIINQETKKQLKEKGYLQIDKDGKVVDIENVKAGNTGLNLAYTGKEVGATGSTATKPLGDGHRTISEYAQQTRGGNLAMYKQQNPNAQFTDKAQETYESYSKKFIGGE